MSNTQTNTNRVSLAVAVLDKELTNQLGLLAEDLILNLPEKASKNIESYIEGLNTFNLGAQILTDAADYFTKEYGLAETQEPVQWFAVAEDYLLNHHGYEQY